MAFIFRELIKKKRDRQILSSEEIEWMIAEFTKGNLPDYQMSAMLMAIYNNSMNKTEASALTMAMMRSGSVIDLSDIDKPKIDKHSTGGVGDKTSMILGPIAAAGGLAVPMMAGRGLGHTGGTLDKLEAIPGFNTQLNLSEFKLNIKEIGISIMGQTEDICPADKKLYALRDVTATVESIPLICASIMSKKLAEGIDGIVLDVKFGSGAFMKSTAQAKELALALSEIGSASGKKVTAVLTNMNQVLGRYVGNAVEIKECVEILRDTKFHEKYFDTVELSLHLAGEMFFMANLADSLDDGIKMASKLLNSGEAYEVFAKLCHRQGGDLSKLPEPHEAYAFCAKDSGYIAEINSEDIGVAGIYLQAGRQKVSDAIDPRSGFEVLVKVGDKVKKGDNICFVFAPSKSKAEKTFDMLQNAFRILPDNIDKLDLVRERIASF